MQRHRECADGRLGRRQNCEVKMDFHRCYKLSSEQWWLHCDPLSILNSVENGAKALHSKKRKNLTRVQGLYHNQTKEKLLIIGIRGINCQNCPIIVAFNDSCGQKTNHRI